MRRKTRRRRRTVEDVVDDIVDTIGNITLVAAAILMLVSVLRWRF